MGTRKQWADRAPVEPVTHEAQPSGVEFVIVGPDLCEPHGSTLSADALNERAARGWRLVSVGYHAGSGMPRSAVMVRDL